MARLSGAGPPADAALPTHLRQPGPAPLERIESVVAACREVEIRIESGRTLLAGLHEAFSAVGATGGAVELSAGSFAELPYVIPALSPEAEHAAWYSAERSSPAGSELLGGSCTYGLRDGEPILHCHAAWTEPQGTLRAGHILTERAVVAEPALGRAWALAGARIESDHDAETNFRLLRPIAGAGEGGALRRMIAARLRPNVELAEALADTCRRHGFARARLRGGVGSIVCPAFADGRRIDSIGTEVFLVGGEVLADAVGEYRVELPVGLVDMAGEVHRGMLASAGNSVCITFEIFLEEADPASSAAQIEPSGRPA